MGMPSGPRRCAPSGATSRSSTSCSATRWPTCCCWWTPAYPCRRWTWRSPTGWATRRRGPSRARLRPARTSALSHSWRPRAGALLAGVHQGGQAEEGCAAAKRQHGRLPGVLLTRSAYRPDLLWLAACASAIPLWPCARVLAQPAWASARASARYAAALCGRCGWRASHAGAPAQGVGLLAWRRRNQRGVGHRPRGAAGVHSAAARAFRACRQA